MAMTFRVATEPKSLLIFFGCVLKKRNIHVIIRNGYALFPDSFFKSFGYGLTRVARYLAVVPKYKFNAKLAIIIVEPNVC